jgi:membrane protein DedA with SNARE-associated domain
MSVALLILGGILVGGTISLVKQGATKFSVAVTGILALLAVIAGILWMIPKEGA